MSAPEQTAEVVDLAEKAAGSDRWNESLHRTKQGEARDVLANAAIILRTDRRFQGRLRWNEMLEATEARALPWCKGGGWKEWTDADDLQLANWCQQRHAYLKPRTVAAAVQVVARDRMHHPVRERLQSLKWDGVPRLDLWLGTYLGVTVERKPGESEEALKKRQLYCQEVGRRFLIQAVARIMEPGCKADHALILEGMQGALKSTTAEKLALEPAWFADEIADLGSKDAAQDLRGKWLVELGELSALKRGDVERVKAFMSRKTDHYRPSYGTRSQDFPRQCVFIGTTNADTYLADETGNRRFWPVKVGRINIPLLIQDREQLWAEAVAAYRAGERWWLETKVEEAARDEQADRRISDPWEAPILEWLAHQNQASVAQVLTDAVKMEIGRQDQTAQNRVARIFRSYGWERHRSSEAGRPWVYRRPSPPEEMSQLVGQEKPSESAACPTCPTCPSTSDTHTRAHTQSLHENSGTEWDTGTSRGNTGLSAEAYWDKPIAWIDEQGWLDRLAKAKAPDCEAVVLAWLKAADGIIASEKPLTVKVPKLLEKCPAFYSMCQNAHHSGIEVVQ